jgi:hypothetical protein
VTLTEFLLAQISEDEAPARRAIEMERFAVDGSEVLWEWHRTEVTSSGAAASTFCYGALSPARVLAECEAKRALIAVAATAAVAFDDVWGLSDAILKPLATVYADRPDYLPEWKP